MKNEVILACSICDARNYRIHKSKTSNKRIMAKKYCSHCKQSTPHKETC